MVGKHRFLFHPMVSSFWQAPSASARLFSFKQPRERSFVVLVWAPQRPRITSRALAYFAARPVVMWLRRKVKKSLSGTWRTAAASATYRSAHNHRISWISGLPARLMDNDFS